MALLRGGNSATIGRVRRVRGEDQIVETVKVVSDEPIHPITLAREGAAQLGWRQWECVGFEYHADCSRAISG